MKDYFEYIAKLEKAWWDSSKSTKTAKNVNTAFDRLFILYTVMCSSSYGLMSFPKARPTPFSVLKLDSKFRVRKRKDSRRKMRVVPSYELGLATEDVFL